MSFYLCDNEIVESDTRPGWTGSLRGPYQSFEDMKEACKLLDEPCRECGKPVCTTYFNREALVRDNVCFSCNFWMDLVRVKDRPDIARWEGEHRMVGGPGDACKGFRGRKWRVDWFDGRSTETDNLWSQGTIPHHFRDRLPPNCTITPL